MNADTATDPAALVRALRGSGAGIAEFLLPLAYTGLVSHVMWVRSPWCAQVREHEAGRMNARLSVQVQLPDGVHSVLVGKCMDSGAVQPTCESHSLLLLLLLLLRMFCCGCRGGC